MHSKIASTVLFVALTACNGGDEKGSGDKGSGNGNTNNAATQPPTAPTDNTPAQPADTAPTESVKVTLLIERAGLGLTEDAAVVRVETVNDDGATTPVGEPTPLPAPADAAAETTSVEVDIPANTAVQIKVGDMAAFIPALDALAAGDGPIAQLISKATSAEADTAKDVLADPVIDNLKLDFMTVRDAVKQFFADAEEEGIAVDRAALKEFVKTLREANRDAIEAVKKAKGEGAPAFKAAFRDPVKTLLREIRAGREAGNLDLAAILEKAEAAATAAVEAALDKAGVDEKKRGLANAILRIPEDKAESFAKLIEAHNVRAAFKVLRKAGKEPSAEQKEALANLIRTKAGKAAAVLADIKADKRDVDVEAVLAAAKEGKLAERLEAAIDALPPEVKERFENLKIEGEAVKAVAVASRAAAEAMGGGEGKPRQSAEEKLAAIQAAFAEKCAAAGGAVGESAAGGRKRPCLFPGVGPGGIKPDGDDEPGNALSGRGSAGHAQGEPKDGDEDGPGHSQGKGKAKGKD